MSEKLPIRPMLVQPMLVQPMLVQPMLVRAFAALTASDAPWVLLRGENDLQRPSGDVDLLVADTLVPRLDQVLLSAGFRRIVSPGRGTHRFYFAHDGADELWLKLDVVSDISFGPYQQWRSSLAAGVLTRRICDGPIYRPAPDDQAWLHLLHLLLDRVNVSSDRVALTQQAALLAPGQGPIPTAVEQIAGGGSAAALLQAARSRRLGTIRSASRTLREAWTRTAPVAARHRWLINRVRRLLRPPILQGRGHRGLGVAIDGPEPLAEALARGIAAEFPVPTKLIRTGDGAASKHPGLRRPGVSAKLWGRMSVRYHLSRGRLVLVFPSAAAAVDLVLVLTGQPSSEHSPEDRPIRAADSRKVLMLDASISPTAVHHRAADLIWRLFVGD